MIYNVAGYIRQLLDHLKRNEYGELASVTGRYYAMDRDKRFERIKIAYDGVVHGEGELVDSAEDVPAVRIHVVYAWILSLSMYIM